MSRNLDADKRADKAPAGSAPRALHRRRVRVHHLALIGCLAALVWAPGAWGTTEITVEDGSPDNPYQRWVNKTKVPTPDVTLQVIEGPCDQAVAHTSGCAYRDRIYVNPTSRRTTQAVFLHELGHVFDFHALTDTDRTTIIGVLHQTGSWEAHDAEWKNRPQENFAEAYQFCAKGKRKAGKWRFPGQRFVIQVTLDVRPGRLGQVCDLVRAAA